jgi:hypothetical protein
MKMFLVLAVLVCFLFTACNKPGVPTEYGKVCDAANEKKYLEVSGFLSDGGSLFCSNTGGTSMRCGFKLLQNAGDTKGFTADVEQGTGANNVEKISGSYKREDIKIHDNSGNLINLADQVKITGQMSIQKDPANSGNDVCFMTVTKIEKQ